MNNKLWNLNLTNNPSHETDYFRYITPTCGKTTYFNLFQ